DHRRRRLHDFLLAQARRAIEADWAAPDPAAHPSYAEVTGERFVNDAERLIKMGAGGGATVQDLDRLLAEVKPVRSALAIADYSVTAAELTKDLTPELQRKFTLKFTVRRPAG